jgi:hypothetical protein
MPLPDRFRCLVRVVSVPSITQSAGGADNNAIGLVYKGNAIVQVGSAANNPPGTIGAFTANYPTATDYLLGSDGTTGAATGIYQNYVVHGSEIEVRASRNDSSHNALNMSIRPYPVGGRDGGPQYAMNSTTFAEQPYAVRSQIPSQTLSAPIVLRSRITSKDILGAGPVLALQQGTGQVGSQANDPATTWMWEVRTNNADSTTTAFNAQLQVVITYDVTFFNRNGLNSTAPSVREVYVSPRAVSCADFVEVDEACASAALPNQARRRERELLEARLADLKHEEGTGWSPTA